MQSKNVGANNLLKFLWIFIGVTGRLLPHLPNVTPMTSLSLFAGSQLSKGIALGTTILTMLLSDLVLSYFFGYPVFSYWSIFTYSGFIIITCLGFLIKKEPKLTSLPVFILCATLFYWLWTNFGVWLTSNLYPKTFHGLIFCYTAALPFLRNAIFGDLVWGMSIFGIFQLLQKRVVNIQKREWRNWQTRWI